MQFGSLAWIIQMFSSFAACHFNMVAASHCSCFAQCVGRGQGSAAGAAEDHMTWRLDALKCMGLMVFFVFGKIFITCCAPFGIFVRVL